MTSLAAPWWKAARPASAMADQPEWSDRTLAALAASHPRRILAPLPADDGSFLTHRGDQVGYLTRNLADAPTMWEALAPAEVVRGIAPVALEVSIELHRASAGLTDPARFAHRFRKMQETFLMLFETDDRVTADFCSGCRATVLAAARCERPESIRCDTVAHADLHPGNVLVGDDGLYVIDLENMLPAPAFTDLIYTGVWARYDPENWQRCIDEFAGVVGRRPGPQDVVAALVIILIQGWLAGSPVRHSAASGAHWLVHRARGEWLP